MEVLTPDALSELLLRLTSFRDVQSLLSTCKFTASFIQEECPLTSISTDKLLDLRDPKPKPKSTLALLGQRFGIPVHKPHSMSEIIRAYNYQRQTNMFSMLQMATHATDFQGIRDLLQELQRCGRVLQELVSRHDIKLFALRTRSGIPIIMLKTIDRLCKYAAEAQLPEAVEFLIALHAEHAGYAQIPQPPLCRRTIVMALADGVMRKYELCADRQIIQENFEMLYSLDISDDEKYRIWQKQHIFVNVDTISHTAVKDYVRLRLGQDAMICPDNVDAVFYTTNTSKIREAMDAGANQCFGIPLLIKRGYWHTLLTVIAHKPYILMGDLLDQLSDLTVPQIHIVCARLIKFLFVHGNNFGADLIVEILQQILEPEVLYIAFIESGNYERFKELRSLYVPNALEGLHVPTSKTQSSHASEQVTSKTQSSNTLDALEGLKHVTPETMNKPGDLLILCDLLSELEGNSAVIPYIKRLLSDNSELPLLIWRTFGHEQLVASLSYFERSHGVKGTANFSQAPAADLNVVQRLWGYKLVKGVVVPDSVTGRANTSSLLKMAEGCVPTGHLDVAMYYMKVYTHLEYEKLGAD